MEVLVSVLRALSALMIVVGIVKWRQTNGNVALLGALTFVSTVLYKSDGWVLWVSAAAAVGVGVACARQLGVEDLRNLRATWLPGLATLAAIAVSTVAADALPGLMRRIMAAVVLASFTSFIIGIAVTVFRIFTGRIRPASRRQQAPELPS